MWRRVCQTVPFRVRSGKTHSFKTLEDVRGNSLTEFDKPGLCQGALCRSISVQQFEGRCPLIEQRLRGALPSKANASETWQVHAIPAGKEYPHALQTSTVAEL